MSASRISVLFVCLGNICRSPLAENVFRQIVRERGLEQRFEVDSAGTAAYHVGEPPDRRSAETALRRGLVLEGRARQVEAADLRRFDYILVMDSENLAGVQRLEAEAGGTAEVRLLREFDPDAAGDLDVPDPYYGGPSGFEDVHDIVERSCRALLDHVLEERGG